MTLLDTSQFDTLTPAELDSRRRALISELTALESTHGSLDSASLADSQIDDRLRELALIAGTLRRRTAGPPKEPKAPRTKRGPLTAADL